MNWNEFRSYNKDKGYSPQQMSKKYKAYKKGKVISSTKKTASLHKLIGTRELPIVQFLKSLPKTREYKSKQLLSVMTHLSDGRGSPTRGWAATAPQRGSERHALMKTCGKSAFLLPESEGYPIMPGFKNN